MQAGLDDIKRVIILVENRFSFRDYQRFGIQTLQQNGFHVEVWELTPILYPELQVYTHPDLFNFDGLTVFNDRQKLYDRLLGLSHTDFVINLGLYRWLTLGFYRALSKSRAKYLVFCRAFPYSCAAIKKTWLQTLVGKIKYIASFRRLETWKHLFIMRLPLWCFGVRPASLLPVPGEKYLNYRRHSGLPIDKNTELLLMHELDYDLYLKEKENPCPESPIAVFLDQFLPFHPDGEMFKRKSPINADRYFRLLNNFFDLVEEKTGLEVVIAAHPRSQYDKLPDYFNGRKCIRGNSVRLVRESKLVLAHSTNALQFANLFYKPVIFMTWSDLYKTYAGCAINESAKNFNKRPILIDRDINIDWEQELKVSRHHYDSYRNEYIKIEGSEDLPSWQIVANRLKKGFS